MNKIILLAIILSFCLAGCMTPQQTLETFCDTHNRETPPVFYEWELLGPSAHAENGVIYINNRHLSEYKACESEILMHEAGHVFGLKHCETNSCLMYFKTHDIPIHLYNKELCRKCEGKLWQ